MIADETNVIGLRQIFNTLYIDPGTKNKKQIPGIKFTEPVEVAVSRFAQTKRDQKKCREHEQYGNQHRNKKIKQADRSAKGEFYLHGYIFCSVLRVLSK